MKRQILTIVSLVGLLLVLLYLTSLHIGEEDFHRHTVWAYCEYIHVLRTLIIQNHISIQDVQLPTIIHLQKMSEHSYIIPLNSQKEIEQEDGFRVILINRTILIKTTLTHEIKEIRAVSRGDIKRMVSENK